MRQIICILIFLTLFACSPSAPAAPVPSPALAIPSVTPTLLATANPTFTPFIPPTATATRVPPTPTRRPVLARPADCPTTASNKVVNYFGFDPLVISATEAINPDFFIQTDGSVTAAQLRLADNVTMIPLTNKGNGLFQVTLTHAQVTFKYGASKANHNFVGFLDVFQGVTKVGPFNIFANILDSQIPGVVPQAINPDAQKTAHLVNLKMPELNPCNPDVRQVTNKFYKTLGDHYDFLAVLFLPERNENRDHSITRSDVQGIGVTPRNQNGLYGSAGKLLGITRYPITGYFDLAETSALHEIGHQWINYLARPALPEIRGVSGHWPVSSLARGIMGYQCCDNPQGLKFTYNFMPVGNDSYQLTGRSLSTSFLDLELYLMGLLPADQVGPHFVFRDQNQKICADCILTGAMPFTVDQIIRAHGPRVPAYGTAPTKFRIATIVASPTLLSASEMAFLDYFAARGEMQIPLAFSSGFVEGTTLPFFLATNKRGCLITTIDIDGKC